MVRTLPFEVDGFRLLKELSRGGMGVVYRGVDLELERPVAIKMILPTGESDFETLKRRFIREAKTTARIESAHIVRIYRVGVTETGELYLAMEFLNGRTLANIIKTDGPMQPERARKIVRQIATALEAAHRAGVVHRDIKAANIVCVEQDGDPEFVKVLDFGVAALLNDDARITRSGAVVGTAGYIPPEQLSGAQIGPSGDLYALGALLFRMLTGEELFIGEDWKAICFQHLSVPATPPSQRVPERTIPRDLDTLTLALLQKNPEDRVQSAADVRAALDGDANVIETASFDKEVATDELGISVDVATAPGVSMTDMVRSDMDLDAPSPGWPRAVALLALFVALVGGLAFVFAAPDNERLPSVTGAPSVAGVGAPASSDGVVASGAIAPESDGQPRALNPRQNDAGTVGDVVKTDAPAARPKPSTTKPLKRRRKRRVSKRKTAAPVAETKTEVLAVPSATGKKEPGLMRRKSP